MENPTNVRCGAPRCPEPPLWRFAVAFPFESATDALTREPQFRCGHHLDLAGLVWLPQLQRGMYVVVDPQGVSPAEWDDERSDTRRMESHLIDADKLRPGRPGVPSSVTVTETQFMRVVVPVPGQLLVPGTDR